MEFLVIVVIIIVFIYAIVNAIEKPKKLQQLRTDYDNALRGSDKSRALSTGRAYYSALRSPKQLTIYDEQAIANDLSTMG